MHGCDGYRSFVDSRWLTAYVANLNRKSEHCSRRRIAQGHYDSWRHDLALNRQPPPAGLDLACVRSLMNSTFTAQPVFEVFYGVGQEDGIALNPGRIKRFIKHLACWPYKRTTHKVLLISGLLTDDH